MKNDIVDKLTTQLEMLREVAQGSPRSCLQAKYHACANEQVKKLIIEKATRNEYVKDLRCLEDRPSYNIERVLFIVEPASGNVSLVSPSFLVECDWVEGKVLRIVDPYLQGSARIYGEFELPPDRVSQRKLNDLYDILRETATGGGTQTLQMTDLLAIVSFPEDVERRIREARGPVTVRDCVAAGSGRHRCRATNSGSRVVEDIPGTAGALGIIIEPTFRCMFELIEATKVIDATDIVGLIADIAGPFNADIVRIYVKVPDRQVVLYYE